MRKARMRPQISTRKVELSMRKKTTPFPFSFMSTSGSFSHGSALTFGAVNVWLVRYIYSTSMAKEPLPLVQICGQLAGNPKVEVMDTSVISYTMGPKLCIHEGHKYPAPHRTALVLLADEEGCHTHPSSDAHRSHENLLISVLGDAETCHDLASAG